MRYSRILFSFNLTMVSLMMSAILGQLPTSQAQVITFEELPVPSSGFYNGDTSASSPFRDNFQVIGSRDNFGQPETLQLWSLNGAQLFNGYTPAFGSWNGWSWSNVTDTTTPGFGNQFAAFPGGGSNGSGGVNAGENYAIGFGNDSFINLPNGLKIDSIDLAASTYSALAMRDGDAFTEAFGGASGDDPDYFRVVLTGYDQAFANVDPNGNVVGEVDFYLADYRFADNSQDYISNAWNQVDLTGLADARSIRITFDSSDPFIPTYVAIDNLQFSAVPEPSGLAVLGLFLCIGFNRRRRD
ncbi:MAG: DUF4465 domain-containing protein [Planctomycetota bacterium]